MRDYVGRSLRLEEWARRDSYLHRRDARAKIVSILVFLIAVSVTPPSSPAAFLPVSILLGGGLLVSGLPLGEVLARGAVIIPFPLFFGLVGWLENGNALFAATIVVRSYISALAVLLLMGITPVPELLRGFQGLHVPAVLVLILQSLLRYLQVIVDHGLRMRRAALCRDGGILTKHSRPSLWRRSSGALAVLFGRSYSRAEGVHRAMAARGFQGQFISPHTAAFNRSDWLFLSGVTLAVLGAGYLVRALA